jgi:hypothetical protein
MGDRMIVVQWRIQGLSQGKIKVRKPNQGTTLFLDDIEKRLREKTGHKFTTIKCDQSKGGPYNVYLTSKYIKKANEEAAKMQRKDYYPPDQDSYTMAMVHIDSIDEDQSLKTGKLVLVSENVVVKIVSAQKDYYVFKLPRMLNLHYVFGNTKPASRYCFASRKKNEEGKLLLTACHLASPLEEQQVRNGSHEAPRFDNTRYSKCFNARWDIVDLPRCPVCNKQKAKIYSDRCINTPSFHTYACSDCALLDYKNTKNDSRCNVCLQKVACFSSLIDLNVREYEQDSSSTTTTTTTYTKQEEEEEEEIEQEETKRKRKRQVSDAKGPIRFLKKREEKTTKK